MRKKLGVKEPIVVPAVKRVGVRKQAPSKKRMMLDDDDDEDAGEAECNGAGGTATSGDESD